MSEICIIGSCVTRDIWRVTEHDFTGKYFARTSVVSLMSQPIPLNEEDINLESKFERACVLGDASRSALDWIRLNRPKQLILDFISERLDLIGVGESFLLRSFELSQSGVIERLFPDSRIVPRASEEGMRLWKKAITEFANFMQECSPNTQIFLHKARFAHESTNGIENIPFSQRDLINSHNLLIDDYFESFTSIFKNTIILEAPSRLLIGSQTHQWGVDPVHYIDEYYHDIWRQFQAISGLPAI